MLGNMLSGLFGSGQAHASETPANESESGAGAHEAPTADVPPQAEAVPQGPGYGDHGLAADAPPFEDELSPDHFDEGDFFGDDGDF